LDPETLKKINLLSGEDVNPEFERLIEKMVKENYEINKALYEYDLEAPKKTSSKISQA
jgi:hypothetical protein